MLSKSKKQQVVDFVKNTAMVRPTDLDSLGLPKEYLYQLYKTGIIERLGRGLYQWPQRDISHDHSLIEATKQVPKSVVVLLSALSFYNFTSQHPFEVWLAIDRKAWRPEVEYPPIRFVTMSKLLLTEGVETHLIDGVEIKITSPARTVADCFKYRHKIGLDVALEALKEGWREKLFTMDDLMKYATLLRVKNVMQPYLESL